VLINLPDTAAAEDSDEDAELMTGVDRSSADDDFSGVPAAKQTTTD